MREEEEFLPERGEAHYAGGDGQIPIPNATAVLVLGIIALPFSFCSCWAFIGLTLSIISLVLAKKARVLYATNPEAYTASSFSNLKAGRICAIIAACISSLVVVIILIYFITVGSIAMMGTGAF